VESSPSTEESRSALSGSGELARSVLFNNVLDTFKSITTNAITCKSTSRPPSPVIGQMIYQTDTNSILFWTGTSWSSTPANATPAGTISAFGGVNLPGGYLWCDGLPQLKASYPTLWAALGVSRYAADTPTQFYTPNLTSHFPRGTATTGGAVTTNNNNAHNHNMNAYGASFTGTLGNTNTDGAHNHNNNGASTSSTGGHNHNNNGTTTTGGSNRNVAAGNTAGVPNAGHQHTAGGTSTSSTGDHNHNVNGASTSSTGGHNHSYTPSGNVPVTQGTVIDATYVPAFVEVNYIIKT